MVHQLQLVLKFVDYKFRGVVQMRKLQVLFRLVSVSAPFASTLAYGANSELLLQVTGSRWVTFWEVNGVQATAVSFNFDNYAGDANDPVDSASNMIKLVDSKASNAGQNLNALYTAPGNCEIGGTHTVPSSDIVLVDGGSEVADSQSVSFQEGTAKPISLRFAASGGHGAAAGDITCAMAGKLTYTY
jgi:hypothetical protein